MPKAATSAASASQPASYEAAVTELEALIAAMERGDMSLEASLASYRRGAELVRYCQKTLEHVEQQISILDAQDAQDAQAPLKPFEQEPE